MAQRAIRRVALQTFRHLHACRCASIWTGRPAACPASIERGAKGIEFLLFFVLFNVLPTLLEIAAGLRHPVGRCTISGSRSSTFVTIGGYVAYTLTVTEWRIKYRREMNEADQEANTKAIDSLLNYETVKYFNNEEHEARRYDVALQAYENAAVKSRVTLVGAQYRPGLHHRHRRDADDGDGGPRRGRRAP